MNGDTALILNTLKVIQSDIAELKAEMIEVKNDVVALKAEMDERFDAMQNQMDTRFDAMQNEMDARFDAIHKEMDERFDTMQNQMDTKFDTMHKEMNERFDTVNCEIRDIRMYLENTINKTIQTIAEGHFDLNRRIDEALAHKYSLEKMEVRMNIAEADIKELKKKIKGQTA